MTKIRPTRAAKRVERDANVKVTWTERLRRSSVNSKSVVLKRKHSSKRVKAQLTYLPGKHRVRLDPKRDLARKATYKVLVKGTIKDRAGNAFDASPEPGVQHLRWRFTTR